MNVCGEQRVIRVWNEIRSERERASERECVCVCVCDLSVFP